MTIVKHSLRMAFGLPGSLASSIFSRQETWLQWNKRPQAEAIVQQLGGPENIKSVTHCATRLRFELVDGSKVDDKAVGAIKGVMGAVPIGRSLSGDHRRRGAVRLQRDQRPPFDEEGRRQIDR